MYQKHQQGKAVIAFMAGTVVALVAIAAMLLTLNQNGESTFRQPEMVQRAKEPEILTPNNVSQAPVVQSYEPMPSASMVTDNVPVSSSAVAAVPAKNGTVASQPESSEVPAQTPVLPIKASEPIALVVKPEKTSPKMDTRPAKVKEETTEVKPLVQDILDTGDMDKARALATQRENRTKQPVVEQSAKSSQNQAKKSGDVKSIQVGAFSNRQAAEKQRALVALEGVETRVVAVQANGKTVYRVQTAPLSEKQAEQVKKNLSNKGVDTYTHK
ncbi:MAG: SPOR domain-containing protein [Alysiella sp.]|uniref:SPOR domain-containing protein n=1 Tax=Alysiella sp. TaxID=1872483 RepID=UPI0026DC3A7E|nr:SPOR domain-containing protein [Alysiella sp.]MDO4433000.1 SPOR domain-containing protein [Alysiella sp.]